jgi:hypothetical protein
LFLGLISRDPVALSTVTALCVLLFGEKKVKKGVDLIS